MLKHIKLGSSIRHMEKNFRITNIEILFLLMNMVPTDLGVQEN